MERCSHVPIGMIFFNIHHHSTLSSIDFFRHCLLSMCFVYISSTVIIRHLDDISHTNCRNFDTWQENYQGLCTKWHSNKIINFIIYSLSQKKKENQFLNCMPKKIYFLIPSHMVHSQCNLFYINPSSFNKKQYLFIAMR